MTDHCSAGHPERDSDQLRDDGDVAPRGERRTATRADLLDAIAAICPNLPRHEVRRVFEDALDEMGASLCRGDAVRLRSFGQFGVRAKRERVGRNPRTGVEVPISSRRVLTFRPSSVLLDLMNALPAAPGADADA